MVASGKTKRVGLLATQGIRGGKGRTVLERIKQTGIVLDFLARRVPGIRRLDGIAREAASTPA